MKNLIKNVLFIVFIAYTLRVKLPSDHVCANDPIFSTLKTLVMQLHNTLLFISEKTPFWIYIPILRTLMDDVKVPSHIDIKIIEQRDAGYKIERIMHKELKNVKSRKSMFYYHGGGMAVGSPRAFPIAFLKEQPDVQVFAIDYRLAPEMPFPAAIDDCIDATRFILNLSDRYNVGEFIIYGESAGGNLVLSTMMEIDFLKEFGKLPVTAHASIPMGQMLRFDTPSYSSPDHQFELNQKLMTEFWLMYSGISIDKYGNSENSNNRELLSRNLHWDESIRTDKEFMSRADPEKWIVQNKNTEKYLPKGYKKVTTNDYDFGKDFPKKLSKLLRNKLFSPGTAGDEELQFLCRNVENVVISVAEFDVLRDDGIMIANRMKSLGCKNVNLKVVEGVGHLYMFESLKNTNLPVGFEVYNQISDDSMDLNKF